jgi:hypothetical protein
MMENKIVLMDSPEAAQYKLVSCWVSRNGKLCTNEKAARFDGCTHRKCVCGNIVERHWLICKDCRDKKDNKRFLAMPIIEWDGETPLCVFNGDQYFYDEGQIEDYCEENEIEKENLKLVLCEPMRLPILKNDFFDSCLDEDSDLPDALQTAINTFNKSVKVFDDLPWGPGKFRVEVKNG